MEPIESPPTSNCYKCGYRENTWKDFPMGRPCPKCGFLFKQNDPAHFKLLKDYVEWEKQDMNRRAEANRNKGCLVFLIPMIPFGVALCLW